jgi:hypothetical protein
VSGATFIDTIGIHGRDSAGIVELGGSSPLRQFFETMKTLGQIERVSRAVIENWSAFSDALADNDEQMIHARLTVALKSSYELGEALFTFNTEQSHFRIPTAASVKQMLSSKHETIFAQYLGVSVPWHLIYVGPSTLSGSSFDPLAEAEWLLGMRRPVVFAVDVPNDHTRQEVISIDRLLLSVGRNLASLGSSTQAVDTLLNHLASVVPTENIEYLTTKAQHDQYFLGDSQYDFDLWAVLTHGGQITGNFGQQTIMLADGEHLRSIDLSNYGDPKPFRKALTVILLVCNSGVVAPDYEIPTQILGMGAGSVLAPYAKVVASKSMDLLENLLRECKDSQVGPTRALSKVKKAQKRSLMDALHTNLFAPLLTTDHILWFELPSQEALEEVH